MSSQEETFRAYNQEQGRTYAAQRPGYAPKLFELIVEHHTSTGGQRDTIVDVGCGPGQAIGVLAPYFARAVGLDPSEGMISTARSINQSSEPGASSIRFEQSTAETLGYELDPPIVDGSVDLLIAATAAHWFDMSQFWPSAARVLKSGGTVALWTASKPYVDPKSTPNAEAIQKVLEEAFLGEEMQPFRRPGNDLTRDLYVDLPLPWTLESPVEEFDRSTFFRKEWNTPGDHTDNRELSIGRKITPEQLENMFATSSPVTRWREANPDKVGTEEDILRRVRRRVEALLHEAGVEPGKELLTGEVAIVLLMVKKKV